MDEILAKTVKKVIAKELQKWGNNIRKYNSITVEKMIDKKSPSCLAHKINQFIKMFRVSGLSNVEVDGKSFSIEPSIKTFQDSDIKIDWTILDSSFEFTLQNLSESSKKILWDNMSFVDIFKESNKVINGETIKAHIGMPQPASIVPKGTKFSAVGVPYPKRRFILNRYLCPEELADSQQNERKYEIGILLPIEKEGNIKEYLFTFKVDDIIVKKVKPSIM